MGLISIITVVRNGAATVRDSVDSVRSQVVGAEHIVVDGASTDGTPALLRAYDPPLAGIVSEPDRGIYDAMNKGIALASGDIVGLLNADDFYAHDHVLMRVAEAFEDPEVDACYGDLQYVRAGAATGEAVPRARPQFLNGRVCLALPGEQVVRSWQAGGYDRRNFFQGWMPPHPTFFVRREFYKKLGGFRLDLGSAADYELMLRYLLHHRLRATYIPEVLVKMRCGGVSNRSWRQRLLAHRLDRRAWVVNGLQPQPWTLWLKPLRKVGQWLGPRTASAAPAARSVGRPVS